MIRSRLPSTTSRTAASRRSSIRCRSCATRSATTPYSVIPPFGIPAWSASTRASRTRNCWPRSTGISATSGAKAFSPSWRRSGSAPTNDVIARAVARRHPATLRTSACRLRGHTRRRHHDPDHGAQPRRLLRPASAGVPPGHAHSEQFRSATPSGAASSTPGAVVLGYFRDDLERFGLLFVYLGHFVFIGYVVEGQRQHNLKGLFRSHGVTSQWVQRTREAPFEIMQNGGNRDARRRERDCDDIILIPVSCAGAVVRHGFAPPAWFGVRLFLFESAHSSIENSLVAGFHLPTPYGAAHSARLRAISTAALTASSRFCV